MEDQEKLISQEPPENTPENNSVNKSKTMSRRHWTSGNFDVIEVFDDESQLHDWLNNQGGGGDWVTECKRDTRTHNVTELICRFSHKYSGRRLSDTTPYDCHARLRIRRPLTPEMDQSIIVEKTAIDHDHEPKEKNGHISSEEPPASIQNASAENSRDSISKPESHKSSEKNSPAELKIDEEYDEFDNMPTTSAPDTQKPESSGAETYQEVKELIKEKTALGWDARKIQNFMMSQRMNAPTITQICTMMGEFGKDRLTELLEKKKTMDEKIKECSQKVSELGKEIAEGFDDEQQEDVEEEEDVEMVDETVNQTLEEIEKKVVEEEEQQLNEMQPASGGEQKDKEDKEKHQTDQDKIVDETIREESRGDEEVLVKSEFMIEEPKATIEKAAQNIPLSTWQLQRNQTAQELANASRPKRNRIRRLYSPSPPPRLGGEPRRKKERSEDSITNEFPQSSSNSLQNVLIGKKIAWAKQPPQQSHSENITTTTHTHQISTRSLATKTGKDKQQQKSIVTPSAPSSPIKFTPMPNLFAKSVGAAVVVPQTPSATNVMRQNEKMTHEISQLKRLNQEQQQQIRALISANRELIWAFNESRREHEELMKQLRMLTTGQQLPNGNGRRGAGNGASSAAAFAVTMPSSTRVGVQKRMSAGATSQQRRGKKRDKPSVVFMPANAPLPLSLSILNKKQQQQPQTESSSMNEQLLASVKKEIEEHELMEEGEVNTPPSDTQLKKLTKEEEMEKIKQQLEDLPIVASVEINKLLGQRRPPFYTPKESGDWHMVIPGDLRRQIIFKIFQALCPEFKQKSIEDYLKAYPSRVDYIKNSLEFAFKTENQLFVDAPSRDAFLQTVAAKMFSLLEAHNRYSEGGGDSHGGGREKRQPTSKRTLADVLKSKRSRPLDEEEGAIE